VTTVFHVSDLHFGWPAVPEQIDAIDRQLLALVSRRAQLAEEVESNLRERITRLQEGRPHPTTLCESRKSELFGRAIGAAHDPQNAARV